MKQVTATVEAHGGKFVARGGDLDIVEGDWSLSGSQYWNLTVPSAPRSG